MVHSFIRKAQWWEWVILKCCRMAFSRTSWGLWWFYIPIRQSSTIVTQHEIPKWYTTSILERTHRISRRKFFSWRYMKNCIFVPLLVHDPDKLKDINSSSFSRRCYLEKSGDKFTCHLDIVHTVAGGGTCKALITMLLKLLRFCEHFVPLLNMFQLINITIRN